MGKAIHSVLIVDDHAIVREGLTMLLRSQPDLDVCAAVIDAAGACRAVRERSPDVALVDLSLGSASGLDLIAQLVDDVPGMPVLALSMHDEALYAKRVLQCGGRGYIMKHEGTDQLLLAIRTVLGGGIYVSAAVNATLLRGLTPQGRPSTRGTASGLLAELSNRELQVYRLLGHGMSTRDIAQQLFLSVKTVESHRANIKQKLGVETTSALVAHAAEWLFRSSSSDRFEPPKLDADKRSGH